MRRLRVQGELLPRRAGIPLRPGGLADASGYDGEQGQDRLVDASGCDGELGQDRLANTSGCDWVDGGSSRSRQSTNAVVSGKTLAAVQRTDL